MVIYVDILLALNWWIDFLLLLGVRRAMGGDGKPWRLAVGALVGAFTCLTLFLPPISVWLSLLLRLASAVVMVTVAFGLRPRRLWLREVILLFALSAGLAGFCSALYFFLAPQGFYVCNGVVYYSVPPLLLVALTVVCYGLLCLSEQILRRRAPQGHLFRVTLAYAGHTTAFSCLYDSGNHLAEPFSGKPVLVVERQVAEVLRIYIPTVADLPAGWRLIPYNTLGGKGLLPAFMPDAVAVIMGGHTYPLPLCYVAVCETLGRGEYQGLMGANMAENLVRKDDKALCFTG